jgi:hypothetical protein
MGLVLRKKGIVFDIFSCSLTRDNAMDAVSKKGLLRLAVKM